MRCDSDARSRTFYRLSSSVTGSSVHAKRPLCTTSVVCRKPDFALKCFALDTAAPICFQPFQFAQKCSELLPRRRKEQSTKYVTQSAAWPTEGSAHAGQPLHQNGPLANPNTEMARGRTLTTFRALPWGTRSARSLAPLSQAPALARHLARSASRLLNPSLARPCLERKPRATDAPGP